jgi:Ca2+-binding RTX toxin-like protein
MTDVVLGQEGNDTLRGMGGNDSLLGGENNDLLQGGLGNDTLIGGLGLDRAEGGEGNDQIHLQLGSAHETEEYLGGLGVDRVVNATGGDVVLHLINAMDGGDLNVLEIEEFTLNTHEILGTTGNDIFDFTGVRFLGMSFTAADLEVSTGDGHDTVTGSDQTGTQINNFNSTRMDYDLGAGNDQFIGVGSNIDVVFGRSGDDTIGGGAGNDTLEGGSGADLIDGEAGNDLIVVRAGDQSESDTLMGGAGVDLLSNAAGANFVFSTFDYDGLGPVMGAGIEQVSLNNGTLFGTGVGNAFDFVGVSFRTISFNVADLEVSTGAGNDVVQGSNLTAVQSNNFNQTRLDYDLGAGNDSFTGNGSMLDVVNGGSGNDTLNGGGGSDTLTGGADADVFVFEADGAQLNFVTDYQDGVDRIDVSATSLTNFADVLAVLSQVGLDAQIAEGSTTIRLSNINTAVLDAGDFIF